MSLWEGLSRRIKDTVAELSQSRALTKLRRDVEIEHLESLPTIPVPDPFEPGVLLSDRIKDLATNYKLIEPFLDRKLKPAAYELSVGDLYSIGGRTFQLSEEPGNNEIVIKPFEVVIIQTLERLNLPDFLIARWNVRVRWAYEGLLWVGAAQVDPGFRGYLSCPLYNLSDKTVRLHRGEEIAVVDFVTTTLPTEKSAPYNYKPTKRSRILFEDYQPDRLQSALATEAQQKLQEFERQLRSIGNRVDFFTTVIAAAIGIIVAVLALFVGNQLPEEIKRWSPALMVSAVALIVAFLSFLFSTFRQDGAPRKGGRLLWRLLVLGLLGALLALELQQADFSLQNRPTQTRQSGPTE